MAGTAGEAALNDPHSKPDVAVNTKPGRLTQALNQSEQVRGKVEQAGVELSSVNAVLKDEMAVATSRPVVAALNQSETIEINVQEAASELIAVNAALAVEIDERHHLEAQLAATAIALHESRAAELKSRQSALHDAVTGLPNLTLFNDRLNTALAQAHRHGWRLAVMFIDLDDFKFINDEHGHQIGDRVLQIVARRLQTMVRSSDTLSRRSGDEFLFLMLEAKDKLTVASFAARIVTNICETCNIDGLKLNVSASVGLAIFPEDGRTAQALLERADVAMYDVKRQHHSSAPPTRGRPL